MGAVSLKFKSASFHRRLPIEGIPGFKGGVEFVITSGDGRRGIVTVFVYQDEPYVRSKAQTEQYARDEGVKGILLTQEEVQLLAESEEAQGAIRLLLANYKIYT